MLDLVDAELLVRPSPCERRQLDRDLCADVVDPLLRRLARQEALCRQVLGRLGLPFLRRRAHVRLGFVRVDDYAVNGSASPVESCRTSRASRPSSRRFRG